MIIDGNFDTLNINGSFDMKDTTGVPVFNVSRNQYMSGKIFLSSPSTGSEYLGEINHSKNYDEFIMYEDDAEILRIKQTSALGIPKYDVTSPFGDFSTKFSLIKKSLIITDGTKEVLSFTGNPTNYTLDIDDNCNIFYVMCIAYGITTLLNIE